MVKRDEKGRFVKGSSGNPNGRSRKSDEEIWLKRLHECVTPDDFTQMVRVGVSRAKAGDSAMLRLLFQYLIGMPTQYVKSDVAGQIDVVIVNWEDNDPSA